MYTETQMSMMTEELASMISFWRYNQVSANDEPVPTNFFTTPAAAADGPTEDSDLPTFKQMNDQVIG